MDKLQKTETNLVFDAVTHIEIGKSNNLADQIAFSLFCIKRKKEVGKPLDISIALNRIQHSTSEEAEAYSKSLCQ